MLLGFQKMAEGSKHLQWACWVRSLLIYRRASDVTSLYSARHKNNLAEDCPENGYRPWPTFNNLTLSSRELKKFSKSHSANSLGSLLEKKYSWSLWTIGPWKGHAQGGHENAYWPWPTLSNSIFTCPALDYFSKTNLSNSYDTAVLKKRLTLL